MKRNMELIRLLLMRSEGDEQAAKEAEHYSVEERACHVALLKDAGFVQAMIRTDSEGRPSGAVVIRLTWQGHDFLQATRDPKIWNKIKDTILKEGVSWTSSLLLQLLKYEAKRRLTGLLGHPVHDAR
jgi:hypothetical protein